MINCISYYRYSISYSFICPFPAQSFTNFLNNWILWLQWFRRVISGFLYVIAELMDSKKVLLTIVLGLVAEDRILSVPNWNWYWWIYGTSLEGYFRGRNSACLASGKSLSRDLNFPDNLNTLFKGLRRKHSLTVPSPNCSLIALPLFSSFFPWLDEEQGSRKSS